MYESVLRLGSVCGFAVGALYLLIGGTHFLLPRDQLRGAEGVDEEFFRSLAERSLGFKVHYWTAAALGLFMLPLIAALIALFRDEVTGGAIWAGAVGLLGAGLLGVDFAHVGVEAPRLAQAFVRLPEAAREAILALGLPHLDPCFLSWGLIGGAMAYLNLELVLRGLIPGGLAGLGVLGGLLLLGTTMGALLRRPRMIDVAAGLGGFLIGPAWAIWLGLALRAMAG